MPFLRCPGRTLIHHTDHTASASTCGIFRLRAKVVFGARSDGRPAHDLIAFVGEDAKWTSSISSFTRFPRAGPTSARFSFDGMR